MQILDNVSRTVRDDLLVTMKKGSKVSIAAACFSIYAYQELKKELENVEELRFIFTSPTFVTEKTSKERREFYIPRLSRERSLYGTEFEVKLRNELTQKAIAKECADWIRRKATFRSNVTQEQMMGFMSVDESSYMPINGFTTVDLGCERGNNAYYPVQKTEGFENGRYFLNLFDQIWSDSKKLQDVTDIVIQSISTAYKENSPDFIYFFTLYNIFNEFLDDISEDVLPNEATGFKDSKIWELLYNFQRDAVLAIINKLEKYNGCILADSVGLGKTFTALAVVKYYENRNKSVLVLCPKKLSENWNTYKGNYVNNPIAADRLRYDVLFHTDLSRDHGQSNGIDLDRLNWGNYDLVVIDESHNFRNGIGTHSNTTENRYQRLMEKVIRAGVKTNGEIKLTEEVAGAVDSVIGIIDTIYDGKALQPENARANNVELQVSAEKLAMPEFKALWARISPKSVYVVDFDTDELVRKAIAALNSKLHVSKIFFKVESGSMSEIKSKDALLSGASFVREKSAAYGTSQQIQVNRGVKYDLIGKLVDETGLTRKAIIAILQGIELAVFNQFKDNPEEFILKAAALINDEKATAIVQHITYDVLDEHYETDVFTEPTIRGKLGVNAMKAAKHLYDHIIYDSTNEKAFAEKLDVCSEVAVYVKLPDGFYISTPVGHYNPDWAIAFYEGTVKHIYFVAETKGSMSSMQLRLIEESKIHCAREHFKAISTDSVVYDVVDSFQSLLDKVMK